MNARVAQASIAIASLIALLSFAPVAQADLAPNWGEENSPTTPTARNAAAMAYDPIREEVVLFGGQTESGMRLGDTWTWDGAEWTLESPPNSPSPRSGSGMAFHAVSGKMILVGGQPGPDIPTETWAWDGSTWIELDPATPAPAVFNPSVASYPGKGKAVLLFGGTAPNGEVLDSTWSWDGVTWNQLTPPTSPQPRWGGPMAYDPENDEMVLFGGIGGTEVPVSYADTWTWDGTTWTKESPSNAPPLGFGLPMAYSPATGSVVKLAAASLTGETETWGWDGSDWTRVSTFGNPPAPRVGYTLALDEANEKLVLFGGFEMEGSVLADTWTFGVQTDQAPTAMISTPFEGQPLEVGERVPVSFACSAAPLGPPVDTCLDSDSNASGGMLDTSSPGQRTYTVEAVAVDGQSGNTSINYEVITKSPPKPVCKEVRGGLSVGTFGSAPGLGRTPAVPGLRVRIGARRNVVARITPSITFATRAGSRTVALRNRTVRIDRGRNMSFRVPARARKALRRGNGSVFGKRVRFRLQAEVKAHGDGAGCFRKTRTRSLRLKVVKLPARFARAHR